MASTTPHVPTLEEDEHLIEEALAEADARPDEPSLPLGPWMRKNLFPSIGSSIGTIIAAVFALFVIRTVVSFIFSEERDWDSVRTNLRLLMTQAYPEGDYTRVWLSVGLVMLLVGISMGITKVGAGLSIKRISLWAITGGALIALGTLLGRPAALRDGEGAVLFDEDAGEAVRQSFGEAMTDRWGWWLIAAVLLAIGLGLWYGFGDYRRRTTFVPTMPFTLAMLGLVVSTTWWYGWGNYTFVDGEYGFEPGALVASTTRNGWTAVWLALVVGYLIGQAAAKAGQASRLRPILFGLAVLSPFIIYWFFLRGPVMDWGHVATTDLPLALAFAIGGGAILFFLANPTVGETGRLIAVALLAFALFNWVAAFFGWYPMLQKVRISFLLLALAALLAPNFAGDRRQRMRFAITWALVIIGVNVLITVINTPSSIETPSDDFAGGYMVTLIVATFTTIFSFPLGVLMALGRTSRLPIFRIMCTTFIEVVRGIPFITVLVFFTLFLPLFLPEGMSIEKLAAATLAFTLFSAAYLAENVRGGLQSVRRGQFEAADALGLNTVQRTGFIVLPQALRVSIPPLVGQMIGTYKETSLLYIASIFDLLYIAKIVIPNQPGFRGHQMESLLFVSFVYWVGCYAMSKYSQRLERSLGLGDR